MLVDLIIVVVKFDINFVAVDFDDCGSRPNGSAFMFTEFRCVYLVSYLKVGHPLLVVEVEGQFVSEREVVWITFGIVTKEELAAS